jgi:multidrug resistance protein, MATE family
MDRRQTTRFPQIDPSLPRATWWGRLAVLQYREIMRLAWPTIIAMWSHSLLWLVDTALLGHYSSVDLAASGLGGLIAWTAYSLFNNLSRINGTFVSQAHGRDDHRAIGDYTWQGLYVAVFCGLLLQIGGYYSHHLLALTRNPPAVVDHAYIYIKWRTASAVFTQVSFCLMGFFQGRREVMIPMWSGLICNVINVVLDVWLIYGWQGVTVGGTTYLAMPALGVKGAAIATSIGTAVGAFYLLGYLLGPSLHRRLYRIHRPPRPDLFQLGRIVRVGSPAAFENFVDMSGFAVFSVIIGTLGTAALAANQISIHLLSFVFMPMWGLTTAGAVLAGNWIGSGKPDQAAAYARQVYKLGLYYMGVLGLVFFLLRDHVFRVFSDDPAVLALGGPLVAVIALFQIPDGLRMVSVGVLQGAGDTRYPMVVSMAVLWGVFIPLTWWLVIQRGATPAEAWQGGAACYGVAALLLYLRFRSGQWRQARIFGEPVGP